MAKNEASPDRPLAPTLNPVHGHPWSVRPLYFKIHLFVILNTEQPHPIMDSLQQAPPEPRRNLPPAEVDCRWWKKGNCTRGSTCFFRHDPDQAGVDSPEERAKAAAAAASKKSSEDGKKGAAEFSGSGK